jgi:hypothetical protein
MAPNDVPKVRRQESKQCTILITGGLVAFSGIRLSPH